MTRVELYDVVIVGGGFAGAATAFFLARELGGRRVLLVDREPRPGVHSSGRNASLVRGPCGDPVQDPLSVEGADFLRRPPEDFPADPRFRRVGSLFVDREDRLADRLAAGAEFVSMDRVLDSVPAFLPEAGTAALWTADDGVIDKQAVLEGYLEGAARAGVELAWGEEVLGIEVEAHRVLGVNTSRRRLRCDRVVLAAGAWAGLLGETAGSTSRLRPTRRHLAVSGPVAALDADAPYVWDLNRGFYFRPAEGGLLMCACDQTSSEPGDCPADRQEEQAIARDFAAVLPSWSVAGLRRCWAGHRTFADRSDGLWEPDVRVAGLHWAAGLGGFGLTASSAIGRRVAAGLDGVSVGQPA